MGGLIANFLELITLLPDSGDESVNVQPDLREMSNQSKLVKSSLEASLKPEEFKPNLFIYVTLPLSAPYIKKL